jgi:4,4'-diaponeurosporenoate glycosyltransferase
LAVGWLVGWWLCWRVPRVPLLNDFVPTPAVSIVIPARDEAHNLPTLLDGLARQTIAPTEVIVVDDDSHDATAVVAREHGATVVTSGTLPDGWTGKAWALSQGVRAAREEVVVLLDADVEPSEYLLARLGSVFARVGGLVSVQPYHRVRRWWERASAFFNLVAVMGVGLASPGAPRRNTTIAAFGPVLVCRRDAFLEHVSHPSVRAAVLDDVALARRVADAGEPITLYGGRGVVDFHMYDRPRELIEGWTKNMAAGAGSTPLYRLALIVGWLTACLVSGWGVLALTWVAVGIYAAFAVQLFAMLRQLGRFGPICAALYPILAVLFVAIFARSVLLTIRGAARWKGRTVRLRER